MELEHGLTGFERKELLIGGAAVLLVILLIGAGAAYINAENSLKEVTGELNASAEVRSIDNNTSNLSVGINPDPSLDFGKVPPQTNVSKFVRMGSEGQNLVNLVAKGNISQYLEFQRKHYFDGQKKIEVSLVPNQTGNYSGALNYKVQTPTNSMGEKWLEIKSWF